MSFEERLQRLTVQGEITPQLHANLRSFFLSYKRAILSPDFAKIDSMLNLYLDLILRQIKKTYNFELFHRRITSPIDYYQFGLDFFRPLILFSESKVYGRERLSKMEEQLSRGENVIFFANHQTEPDPQTIHLLLGNEYKKIVEEMIFIAGHRVVTDPLAVPFSMGLNLLCIISKKYLETPPEQKQEKLLRNQRTMKVMSQLLSEGGKCIYVAPSGGRDRPNSFGKVDVARFDPQSIEMFLLMARKSGKPTHFYPLAMSTYRLLPPPNSVQKAIGESRSAHSTPVHLAFGEEISMDEIPGIDVEDKRLKRKIRADYIWNLVQKDYANLLEIDGLQKGKKK